MCIMPSKEWVQGAGERGAGGKKPEPEIVNVKRAQRIDYKESIPPAYVAWRVGTTNRVIIPARQAT